MLNILKEKAAGLDCSMIVLDSKSIYMNFMPAHIKRKKQLLRDLLNIDGDHLPKYVTLTVSFDGENDDVLGPSVRYYFAAL